MSQEDLTPLEGSIKKWEDIVKGSGEDDGVDNCPLCDEYLGMWPDVCKKCPVNLKTSSGLCANTPYYIWDQHHKHDHDNIHVPYRKVKSCPTCDTLAQAELDFLKSLRPKGEPV